MKPGETYCLLKQEEQSCEQTGLLLTLPLIPRQGYIGEIRLGLCCSKQFTNLYFLFILLSHAKQHGQHSQGPRLWRVLPCILELHYLEHTMPMFLSTAHA